MLKPSLIIALFIIIIIGYNVVAVKSSDCPYDSFWSDTDRHTIKLPPVSERKVVKVITYRPGDNSPTNNLIPKIIIQTNETDQIPQKMFDATGTILRDNPGWTYIYFTDVKAREYLEKYFNQKLLDAYDKLIPGAYKADLFRYCFLLITGGVYIDMGMVSLASLDKIIRPTDTFVSPEDNGANGIYNAVIAASPGHPILRKAISLAVHNIMTSNYTHNPLGITGPLLLGRAFEEITGEKVHPGRDYGDGVRIIEFTKYNKCESGKIHDGAIDILATRYPKYRVDQIWYNTKQHYSELWKKKEVFN